MTMKSWKGGMVEAVIGDVVRLPDNTYGRIETIEVATVGGYTRAWVGVRQDGRLDEWHDFQLVRC